MRGLKSRMKKFDLKLLFRSYLNNNPSLKKKKKVVCVGFVFLFFFKSVFSHSLSQHWKGEQGKKSQKHTEEREKRQSSLVRLSSKAEK